jgi:carbon monoxide dehydrogenase subunit G
MRNLLILLLLGVLSIPVYADNLHNKDIEVKVQVVGDDMLVDANLTVPASTRQVWDVLTDFDRMAGFISNLQSSRIIGRSDTVIQVSQKGVAKYLMISFPFELVREMRLFPYEKILSHMVNGTMHKMETETQLIGEGNQTRIVYHADAVPGAWIPPVIGKMFIEYETSEQFRGIVNEILKRKQTETKSYQANAR